MLIDLPETPLQQFFPSIPEMVQAENVYHVCQTSNKCIGIDEKNPELERSQLGPCVDHRCIGAWQDITSPWDAAGISDNSSVQSLSRVWPHALLHARPPCPSATPRVCSNSCLLSPWCQPTISSSVTKSRLSIHRMLTLPCPLKRKRHTRNRAGVEVGRPWWRGPGLTGIRVWNGAPANSDSKESTCNAGRPRFHPSVGKMS